MVRSAQIIHISRSQSSWIRKQVDRLMIIAYEKPMVAVERYELSQTITACITKIDAPREMKSLAVGKWFTSQCDNFMRGGQSSDGICYHTNANAAFKS